MAIPTNSPQNSMSKNLSSFIVAVAFFSFAAFFFAESLCANEARRAAGDRVWETIPIFHQGRVMPLDAFARMSVRQICGREAPRLSLRGAELENLPTKPSEKTVRKIESSLGITPTKGAKFPASELLFSWMTQPELWEFVPFFSVENEALRKLMGLPLFDDANNRLDKASPAQLVRFYESDAYEQFSRKINEKNSAKEGGLSPEDQTLFELLSELERNFFLYHSLTFHPTTAQIPSSLFMEQFAQCARAWGMSGIGNFAARISVPKGTNPRQEIYLAFATIQKAAQDISRREAGAQNQDFIPFEVYQSCVTKIVVNAEILDAAAEDFVRRLANTKRPERVSESDWENVQLQTRMWGMAMRKFRIQTNELLTSLYDNGTSLYMLPALDAAPLDMERDENLRLHPWVSLNALLYGDESGALRRFNSNEIEKIHGIRAAFFSMEDAWKNRQGEKFHSASVRFRDALRFVATSSESRRTELLPPERTDLGILAATAYPTDDAQLRREVRYYESAPFLWAWILPFASAMVFGFGMLWNLAVSVPTRTERFIFAFGILLLLGGILANTWGLALRSIIMERAPVTNMFETIVFVSWSAAVLGIWLTFQSRLNKIFRDGWAFLSLRQFALTPGKILFTLTRFGLAFIIFWALTLAGLGSGEGYNAINLSPRVAIGATTPTLSDWTVWLTGMLMLGIFLLWIPRLLLAPVVGSTLAICRKLFAPADETKRLAGAVSHRNYRYLFAFSTALISFVISYTAYASPSMFNPNLRNLMPILRDNYWLSVHVVTIVASYGAGMLAWIFGIASLLLYTFGRYPVVEGRRTPPPICSTLSELIYRCMQGAILLLIVGTILGGLWADVSWGRFWSWDRKEVWALISLFVYLLILHGRYVRLLGEFTLAIGAILGALAIIMAWYGVNYVLGSTLHGYGSGQGSLTFALVLGGTNLALVLGAIARYLIEKSRGTTSREIQQ
ncbi:MAG: cytochrome c biogenesis protein CcsA [Planctomycetia bacterium]|nr:cytochrome c biogenesis protein CcsA [Planctomycetia bacterium]